MNIYTDVHLWIFAVLVVLMCCLCFFVTAEEACYRGEAHLEYDNPCSGEPGEPAKLELCTRGKRLTGRCKESTCDYCDEGTYQDTFTNCSTCLPCTTSADCRPGQVLISACDIDSNAVCGCPAPPPCPTCESCPTAPPCPPVTPCPVQTECPACECSTNAPVTTGPQEATKLTLIRDCPANILEGPLSGSETKTVRWKEPQTTDGATIVQSHHPGDRFFAGNTTVVYVFKVEELVIDCSFVVTVLEDTFSPTTPSREDKTTENNTPESDPQVGSDFDTCWIWWTLSIVLGTLNLIFTVCLILNCRKKNVNPQKGGEQPGRAIPNVCFQGHANCQLQPPIVANPDVPQGECGEQPGRAIPNVCFQGPANGQLQPPIQANPAGVPQEEYPAHQPVAAPNEYQIGGIQMDPLGQTAPPPGNNNVPANGDIGVEHGSATSSSANLELDPPQQNTPPPGNTLNGADGGDIRNAATTSYTEDNRLHSTDQYPARDDPTDDEATIDGEDAIDSRTPFLPPRSTSSVPNQRHPEQLIFDKRKRNSPVLEMEIRWLAAVVYKHFSHQHEILYGRLNITDYTIDKIRLERLQNNSYKSVEDDVFKIVNYGWLRREGLEQEETRAHLIKQLDTFDKKLAEAYAAYINDWDDFSIMGPV